METVLLFVTAIYSAQSQQQCGTIEGIVAEGVDFVQLRTDYDSSGSISRPQRGSKNYSQIYENYEFLFLNSQNQKLFAANPNNYAPKYGCYCAYAMTGKDDHCGNLEYCLGPLCANSVDGYHFLSFNETTRLYCFLSIQAKDLFLQDPNSNIVQANTNWPLELQRMNVNSCWNTNMFNSKC